MADPQRRRRDVMTDSETEGRFLAERLADLKIPPFEISTSACLAYA